MSYLQNLIDLLPVKVSNPSTNILTGKPFPDQVKIAKDYVCIILANVVQEPSVIKQAADSVNTETIKQDTTSTIMHNSAVSTIGLTSEIKKDSAEKKIISPVFVDKQYSTTTEITSIELTSDRTIINMRMINTYNQGGWCNIDIWTYITAGKKKYRIISSKGIPRKPKKYYFNKSVDKYINLTNRLLRRFYRGFSNDLENVRNSLLCVIILSNNPCQKQR